jgi:histidine triad (HIT) family protein
MIDCVFCRIARGEIPARVVARSDLALAFHDLNPQAPLHVLVIPTEHWNGANEVGPAGARLWPALLDLAVQVVRQEGVADSGYRLVLNSGSDGGQSVAHLHVHVLGGRRMTWPPG